MAEKDSTNPAIAQRRPCGSFNEENGQCASRLCGTRQRLLAAASDLFAQKSYHAVTVAEICRLADANIAAVNYHFGGKENLYAQAWKHAFTNGVSKYPPDGGVAPDETAEKRLAGRITAMLRRATDESNAEFNIAQNELHNPTGLLQEVLHDSLDPMREQMRKIILELLGPAGSDRNIRLCHMSVISQIMHLIMRRRLHRSHERQEPLFNTPVDEIATHITEFSLAGIKSLRDKHARSGGS